MRSLVFCSLAALTALTSEGLANETHKPGAPAALQAENSATVAGTVQLTWRAVKGATEYIVASSRETESSWQNVATTNVASYEFVDLPEGTKYYFRVACNTKSGPGPWSSAVILNTTSSSGLLAAQKPANLPARMQALGR